jgi:hypothetical protein
MRFPQRRNDPGRLRRQPIWLRACGCLAAGITGLAGGLVLASLHFTAARMRSSPTLPVLRPRSAAAVLIAYCASMRRQSKPRTRAFICLPKERSLSRQVMTAELFFRATGPSIRAPCTGLLVAPVPWQWPVRADHPRRRRHVHRDSGRGDRWPAPEPLRAGRPEGDDTARATRPTSPLSCTTMAVGGRFRMHWSGENDLTVDPRDIRSVAICGA